MRPKGWENTKEGLIGLGANNQWEKDRYFEAGADAYEKGLKKGCFYSGKFNDMPHDAMLPLWDKKGHLVYIPEEKDD